MQLKRDTDYAVRILYCLNQNHDADDPAIAKGLTLTKIAMQTGAPKVIVGRICKNLEENGFICLVGNRKTTEKAYYATEALSACSLLDVVKAVEGSVEIFAVFDKKSELYKNCGEQFLTIQGKIERLLAEATVERLFEMKATTK